MAEDGRNRRHKGPLNRLRRALYGAMLMSASLPALAGSHDDSRKGVSGAHALPHVLFASAAQRESDLLLLRDPTQSADAALAAYGGAAALLAHARSISPDFALVPVGGRLQAIVSYHNWRSNAGGARPDVGQVPQVSLKWSF